jgi:CxxC-x17-CxxC domain-containing protein
MLTVHGMGEVVISNPFEGSIIHFKRCIFMFEDKNLVCRDCGNEFVFTAGEQEFYDSKGFQNEPTRCKDCRGSRKSQFNRSSDNKKTREFYNATCSVCGKEAKIPFKPHLDKPVFCSECFSSRK